MTSKLQVTIPKSLATRHKIKAGDDVEWSASADAIMIKPQRASAAGSRAARLKTFDEATARQRRRQKTKTSRTETAERDWTREELYRRGGSR